MPLTLRCRRVWSSNLSTQLRRTLSLNTESLTMPATVADPNRSLDSEQISPATIAHHTVYEKTPNLHQSHICQWGAQPYLVGPLSRLVGKPPLSPWVSADFLPLTQVVNNTNSAIPLTEIFDRVFSDVCNSLGFEVQKQKKRGSGNNRVYRNLKEKSKQMYPVMGEKSEHYITSRNGWVSLKGIFTWYVCRRDPSTYQNTPGPSGHTNV